MGSTILLYVWFSILSFHYAGHYNIWDIYTNVLFSTVWRGGFLVYFTTNYSIFLFFSWEKYIYIYIYRTSIFCGVLASSSFWEFSIDGVPKNFSSRSPKLRNLRKHFIESALNRIFAETHKNTESRTTGLIRYLRMLLLYLVWFRKFLVVQCQVQYYKRPRFSLHKLTLE